MVRTDSDTTRTITHAPLHEFTATVLRRTGLTPDHGTTVADSLVDANLRGIDTHGVVRLEAYVSQLENGGMNPRPDLSVSTTGSTGIVEADDGPGHVATMRAMDTALELAADLGSAFVGVRNSSHFGTASYFTNAAAEDGFVGIAMTHAAPNMVPFGGTEPFFGTNPLSISLPGPEYPITLDMATTVAAYGNVVVAQEEDETIPDTWAVDETGAPTTDPDQVHALQPVGGPKGYGLGLIIDALCGALMELHVAPEVESLYGDHSQPMELGHLVGAIDVEAFTTTGAFLERLESMVATLHAMEPAEDVESVMVPGEPEVKTKRERLETGIPIGPGVWETLESLSETYDVPLEAQ